MFSFDFAIANSLGKYSTSVQSVLIGGSAFLCSLNFGFPVWAQVKPDQTLGVERSSVTAIDSFNQRIDGGAIRGGNLFHSFQEFNVSNGHGVYFGNPARIDNILSRVTGTNPSRIFGTLGVLGKADLYFLNPNGLIFGPNAALDIQGSFYGSTAERISLGDQGSFDAMLPQNSTLLSVQPNANFLTQALSHQGSILNQGQLATGQNLSLTSKDLNLEGQVMAGNDLTLKATNTLKIRDSETDPFVAAAGNHLLVQGDQMVDIFALNHPQSGLFSRGDMVLRSPRAVQGDAFYFSGGNFRIEDSTGGLGSLLSPKDPIIFSLGDVSFDNYSGSSLHILAAGSVKIGTVFITNPEESPAGFDFIQETIELSDGSRLEIDGSQSPTLDVRAGVNPDNILTSDVFGFDFGADVFFDNNGFLSFPTLTNQPTNASIEVGNVILTEPNGVVYFTTQYQPNFNVTGGDITIIGESPVGNFIDVQGIGGNAGSVIFDARASINVGVATINTRSDIGEGGPIKLLANQNVSIFNSDLFLESDTSNSGSLDIQANSIQIGGVSRIITTNFGDGDAGTIHFVADQDVAIAKTYIELANIQQGQGGTLEIQADSIDIGGASTLVTSNFGAGDAGDIQLFADQSIKIGQASSLELNARQGKTGALTAQADQSFELRNSSIFSALAEGGTGMGRRVNIGAESIQIVDGAKIVSTSLGTGDTGSVELKADDTLIIDQSQIQSTILAGKGNSEGIRLIAKSLEITNGSNVLSSNFGQGNSGRISLQAEEGLLISQSDIASTIEGELGNSNGISISANAFNATDSAVLTSETSGRGDAGPITIDVSEDVKFTGGSQLRANTSGQGNGGSILIQADGDVIFDRFLVEQDQILSRSGIFSNTFPTTNDPVRNGRTGGSIEIDARSLTLSQGAQFVSATFGQGDAGRVHITVKEDLALLSGGQIFTNTFGLGRGGDITIRAGQHILFDDFLVDDVDADGLIQESEIFRSGLNTNGLDIFSNPDVQGDRSSGNLSISAQSLLLSNGARINTSTDSQGNAGKIKIESKENLALLSGSQLRSETFGLGNGGDVEIIAGQAVTIDGFQELASLPTPNRHQISPSGIITTNSSPVRDQLQSDRSGGDILIRAESLALTNTAQLNALTQGQGNAGDITVNVRDFITLSDGLIVSTAENTAVGNGGAVDIDARSLGLNHHSQIVTNTFSPLSILTPSDSRINSQAGHISIETQDFVSLNHESGILSTVGTGGVGQSGSIDVNTATLSVLNGSQVQAILFREQVDPLGQWVPGGRGLAGTVSINAKDSVTLSGVGKTGFSSGLLVLSERGAFGPAGDITVTTGDFEVSDGAVVAAGIFNNGGIGGDVVITAENFKATEGGQILTNTRGPRRAGSIKLNVTDTVLIDGVDTDFANRLETVNQTIQQQDNGELVEDIVINVVVDGDVNSGLFANTAPNSAGRGGDIIIDPTVTTLQNRGTIAADSQGSGRGGDIRLESGDLFLRDRAEIRANAQGEGDAGSITFNIDNQFNATDSDVTTSAAQSSGGDIQITATQIRLNGDSDIRTNVAIGRGGGGDITLTADTILAFDDSDILAFADPAQGVGGDITLNTPAFFGENFFGETATTITPEDLDGNGVVNLNATGQTSGIISVPDVSFIQNNLTDLPDNVINTETLLADSCIVRTASQQGKFIVTGSGGMPTRPRDASASSFSTGDIQAVTNMTSSAFPETEKTWQVGDPIVEPQEVYQLPNGRLVLSREC